MAIYSEKYYATFSDTDNNRYKLSIEEINYTGSSTQVKLAVAPSITYPAIQVSYDWFYTSGIEFELLSETDRQFIDMFTNEMQKFRIILYIYSKSSYTVVWSGYIDNEIYSENLNAKFNYNVKITGNDGFNLLKNYKYVDDNNQVYSGITNVFTVLKNCLTKLNIVDNTDLYLSFNKSTGLSGEGAIYDINSNYNLLEKYYGYNENFYDEENEPMSCYDVINSILNTYQIYLFKDCGLNRIYLIDDLCYKVSSGDTNYFYIYDLNDWTLKGKTSIELSSFDINNSSITIQNTTGNLQMQTGINSQKIEYSQYATNVMINWKSSESDFSSSATTTVYSTDSDYGWKEVKYTGCTYFNKTSKGSFCSSIGTGAKNYNNKNYYIKINENEFSANNTNTVFTLKYKLPFLNASEKYYLKIGASAYFRTRTIESDDGVNLTDGRLMVKINIGNKRYVSSDINNIGWVDTYNENDGYYLDFYDTLDRSTYINDMYMGNKQRKLSTYEEPFKFQMIPLDNLINGIIELNITDYAYVFKYPNNSTLITSVKDIRINSFDLSLVDTQGNEIDLTDLQYEGYEDEKYKSKGKSIKYVIGTNVNDIPISRGSILIWNGSKYANVNKVYYSRVVDGSYVTPDKYNIIENLNLKNILNQNKVNRLSLSMIVKQLPYLYCNILYTLQFNNKQFMINSITNDYDNNTSKLNLIEYDNN